MTNVEQVVADYPRRFKNLYYRLYTNSNSSRAEKLIYELSRILLLKLAAERRNGKTVLSNFIDDPVNNQEDLLKLGGDEFEILENQDKYFSLDLSSVVSAFAEISDIELHSAPGHIVGDAFQALIGPTIRGDKGQFFTPKNLTDAIIKILSPKPGDKIIDPACGTGGFLSSCQAYWELTYKDPTARYEILGIDKDADMAMLSSALLEISTNGFAKVVNSDSLKFIIDNPQYEEQFDIVVANPPFGTKIKVDNKAILKDYQLGHSWKVENGTLCPSRHILGAQDPQILFIELCVKLLKENGRMALILPEGVFGGKSSEYVWEYLKNRGIVFALIDCPRTTFQPYTDIKTNVLFFKKTKEMPEEKTQVAVAKRCGHDKRGRTHYPSGLSVPDDFADIANLFHEGIENRIWKSVCLKKEYRVPRYYFNDDEAGKLDNIGQVITIGELIRMGVLKIRKGHEVGSENYGTGDIPFIRTSDINNLEFSSDPTNSVSEEIYEMYSKKQNIAAGDILMAVDGRYRIGKTALVTEENSRCIVQSHIKILSVEFNSLINNYELLYMLNLAEVQNQVRNMVFVQSTLGTLGNRLEQVKIAIPRRNSEWDKMIAGFKHILEERSRLLVSIRGLAHEAEL
ncbi:N-6 DNA methylase [Deinococcus radiophilus]|uniref:N-6 DNA methylase n=1 Tax=Deinococcus radiophilus TaxID=32062 RepID=A0A431VRE1_9DEIO|nr:N-6 DNA methylase [Deinococcus radiophilus]RTR25714.1 N-6 DNA methylase [Deinococcus radiophilus]UFA50213.1 N-6 DNA methylase [Deinococcus radiophilus]